MKDQELKTGAYKVLNDIVDIDFKGIVNMGEVINITRIEFDRPFPSISEFACASVPPEEKVVLNITFQMFGVSGEFKPIVLHGNEKECVGCFSRTFKKIN